MLTGYWWLSSVTLNKFLNISLKQENAAYFQIIFSHFSIIVLLHWLCLWKASFSKHEKVQYNPLGTVNLLLDPPSGVKSFTVVGLLTQRFGDWILSPPSDGFYSAGHNRWSQFLSRDTDINCHILAYFQCVYRPIHVTRFKHDIHLLCRPISQALLGGHLWIPLTGGSREV
jgi:hypothetical protein